MMYKEYPIIGMSPGNSYFKEDKIKYILKACVEEYGRTAIMVPDVPAISTYKALGYTESEASDKAVKQGKFLKTRIKKVIAQLSYTTDQVRIIDWETEIETNEEYKKSYKDLSGLYDSNEPFRSDVNETIKGVILGSNKEVEDLERAVKTGSHYLISELAFLGISTKLLNTEKITFVYHNNWPVYENYIAGKYDGKVRECMGFILMKGPDNGKV